MFKSFVESKAVRGITHHSAGVLQDGRGVEKYRMTNASGIVVEFLNLGGAITAIYTPDRHKKLKNIVLGHESLEDYNRNKYYFGAIIGRYANRIAQGKFTLGNQTYHLPMNNGTNSLHGGTSGFNLKIWQVEIKHVENGLAAVLTCSSPDGDNGFPGCLNLQVIYTLEDSNVLRIEYQATTDKPTIINLTNHTYFNLDGNGSGSALGQLVEINADHYTPTDANQIPTGEISPVNGTPMDFRSLRPIESRLCDPFEQLAMAHGYDHNWVLNKEKAGAFNYAAKAYSPKTGRIMLVSTTEPGLQFYTANYLDGSSLGSSQTLYRQGEGYTFETQHFPDSPNHPHFPNTVLEPGQIFHSVTAFSFLTD